MRDLRPGSYALVLLVILSGLGLAWGAQTVASKSEERGDVVVDWKRMEVDQVEVVRVWIRNAGDRELEGSPKILILNENGGVQQTYAFGQFVIGLDPDESVYVDWALGTVYRCHYGMTDADGAAGVRYPCTDTMSAAPADEGATSCFDCYQPPPRLQGRFILVGVFGEHADATVIELNEGNR